MESEYYDLKVRCKTILQVTVKQQELIFLNDYLSRTKFIARIILHYEPTLMCSEV